MFRQGADAFGFNIGKQIITLVRLSVSALAGLPGHNIHGGVRFFGQFLRMNLHSRRKRHWIFMNDIKHLHGADGTVALDFFLDSFMPRRFIRFVFFIKAIQPQRMDDLKPCVLQSLLQY